MWPVDPTANVRSFTTVPGVESGGDPDGNRKLKADSTRFSSASCRQYFGKQLFRCDGTSYTDHCETVASQSRISQIALGNFESLGAPAEGQWISCAFLRNDCPHQYVRAVRGDSCEVKRTGSIVRSNPRSIT